MKMTTLVMVAGLCLAGCCSVRSTAQETAAGEIVFSSNRSGPWRLWTVGPDGTGLAQLTKEGGDEEHDVDPNFGPDGKTIVFTSTRGGTAGIWTVNADGTGLKRICDGKQAEWSPDGKSLCLIKNDKVFTRDLASGTEKRITDDSYKTCSGPAWSPDGSAIAFACRWEAGNGLFIVPASGGEVTKVYDKKGACEPHWSPDGKHLVYETETHICRVAMEDFKTRMLTYWGGVQRYGQWSPDGARIVYCQGISEKGPWDLYVIDSNGGSPASAVRVTDAEGSDMNPDWR